MLSQSQSLPQEFFPPAAGEISAAGLLESLAPHAGKPLIFRYEGRDVLPGYHVTEVKSASFEALDCGANYESWRETFVQLWDVPGDGGRGHMPAGKFSAIMGKVAARVPFEPDAKLTFEVSDGTGAIALYFASSVEAAGDAVRVALARRPASCKPRDRWLEQQEQKASCCGVGAKAKCC